MQPHTEAVSCKIYKKKKKQAMPERRRLIVAVIESEPDIYSA